MNILSAILSQVEAALQAALIDNVPAEDASRAGVVHRGFLQGNPDPDQARISVTIHENDPDRFYGKSGSGAMSGEWEDRIAETECGGAATWNRRFTVKARLLFINTGEDEGSAQSIASTLRARIERALMTLSFSGVVDEDTGEYVSRGVSSKSLYGEMVQSGGPPDAYDYFVKVRFEVQTTTLGVQP